MQSRPRRRVGGRVHANDDGGVGSIQLDGQVPVKLVEGSSLHRIPIDHDLLGLARREHRRGPATLETPRDSVDQSRIIRTRTRAGVDVDDLESRGSAVLDAELCAEIPMLVR